MAGVDRNGLVAFDPMVNEGKKGLEGEEEEVVVQQKKEEVLEEEVLEEE